MADSYQEGLPLSECSHKAAKNLTANRARRSTSCGAIQGSFLFTGALPFSFALTGWHALVFAVLGARVPVAAPASLAVITFLFAGGRLAGSHQIPNAAISTGVAGRPLPP